MGMRSGPWVAVMTLVSAPLGQVSLIKRHFRSRDRDRRRRSHSRDRDDRRENRDRGDDRRQ